VALVCHVRYTFLRYNRAEWTEICNWSNRISPGKEALSIGYNLRRTCGSLACLKDPNTRELAINEYSSFPCREAPENVSTCGARNALRSNFTALMVSALSHHTVEDYVKIKRAINKTKDSDNMLFT